MLLKKRLASFFDAWASEKGVSTLEYLLSGSLIIVSAAVLSLMCMTAINWLYMYWTNFIVSPVM